MSRKQREILVLTSIASGLLVSFSCWLLFSGNAGVGSFAMFTTSINQHVVVTPTHTVASSTISPSSQDNPITNLLSGLAGAIIGAVIGGLLTYFGSVKAAREQIQALYKQERDNRDYTENQQINTMKQALLMEAQENFHIAQNWGGTEFSYYLSTEAWSIYKGELNKLPEAMQASILQANIEVKRYNSLVDFDKFDKLRR